MPSSLMAILNDIPDVVGFVLIALIWIALISIPGLGITYLGGSFRGAFDLFAGR